MDDWGLELLMSFGRPPWKGRWWHATMKFYVGSVDAFGSDALLCDLRNAPYGREPILPGYLRGWQDARTRVCRA